MAWAKPTIHYCESDLSGLVAQPANAVSSLFISIAGLYILKRKAHQYSLYLGLIAIVLGLASFIYYASYTFVGQLADLGAMFLLASLMVVAGRRSQKPIPILVVGAGIPLILTAVFRTVGGFNIGIPFFVAVLLVSIYFEISNRPANLRFYYLTFATFALSFFFWWLDYKKIWCSASSNHIVNGHAVWHFLNAAALVFLDRHYSINLKRE